MSGLVTRQEPASDIYTADSVTSLGAGEQEDASSAHTHTRAHALGRQRPARHATAPSSLSQAPPARGPRVQVPAPFLSPAPPGSGFLFPVAGSDQEHLGSEASGAADAMPGLSGPTSHASDHHRLTRGLTGSLVCGSITPLSYISSVCFLDQIYTRFQTALPSHINNENAGGPVFGIA